MDRVAVVELMGELTAEYVGKKIIKNFGDLGNFVGEW